MSDETKGLIALVLVVVALFLAGTCDYPDRVSALAPATAQEQRG